MTLKSDTKFEEKLTCRLGNDMKNLATFTRALEIVKTWTLMESFCTRKKIYELKTYRGVMRHVNEEWYINE